MRLRLLIIFTLLTSLLCLQGCETVVNSLYKIDAKMRELLW